MRSLKRVLLMVCVVSAFSAKACDYGYCDYGDYSWGGSCGGYTSSCSSPYQIESYQIILDSFMPSTCDWLCSGGGAGGWSDPLMSMIAALSGMGPNNYSSPSVGPSIGSNSPFNPFGSPIGPNPFSPFNPYLPGVNPYTPPFNPILPPVTASPFTPTPLFPGFPTGSVIPPLNGTGGTGTGTPIPHTNLTPASPVRYKIPRGAHVY